MAWRPTFDSKRIYGEINLQRLKALEALLKYLSQRISDKNLADDNSIRGLESLKRHVKKRGNLRSTAMDISSADLFGQYLRYYGVPYSASTLTLSTGDEKVVFTTRDVDRESVKKAVSDLRFELGIGLSEIQVSEFLQRNCDMTIEVIGDLSEVEVSEFRSELSKKKIGYAVNKIADGNFEILYAPRDSKIIRDAALCVAYNFSGEIGRKYKSNLQQELDLQKEFDQKLYPESGEVLFVVDSSNPNVFIAVDRIGFSTHNLLLKEEVDPDSGAVVKKVEDKSVYHRAEERPYLMNYVNQLHNPVIIRDVRDFGIIEDINNHSVLLKDPVSTQEAMTSLLSGRLLLDNQYIHEKVRQNLTPDSKIYAAVELPDRVIIKLKELIETKALHHTVVEDNRVAYGGLDKKAVEKLLKDELYKEISDPLDYYERKLRYTGAGQIHLRELVEDKEYLVDADNLEFVICLDKQRLTVYSNGEKNTEILRSDPEFSNISAALIEQMACPIVLSEQEFNSPDKLDYITSRTPQMQAREERSAVIALLDIEKSSLLESYTTGKLLENLSERQRESISYNSKWKINKEICDDLYISQKLGNTIDNDLISRSGYGTPAAEPDLAFR